MLLVELSLDENIKDICVDSNGIMLYSPSFIEYNREWEQKWRTGDYASPANITRRMRDESLKYLNESFENSLSSLLYKQSLNLSKPLLELNNEQRRIIIQGRMLSRDLDNLKIIEHYYNAITLPTMEEALNPNSYEGIRSQEDLFLLISVIINNTEKENPAIDWKAVDTLAIKLIQMKHEDMAIALMGSLLKGKKYKDKNEVYGPGISPDLIESFMPIFREPHSADI